MGVSGRTSKVSTVVAALCIAIYIAAIAFGAVQIIINIGERKNRAEREFQDLADRAASSAVFLGFMSEAYRETIIDFLGTSETLLGIIITGSNGEYAFERNTGSGIVWAGESPRFKTGLGFPAEPFFLPLRIEGQRNVTIQAIYSMYDSVLIVRVLRDTLLAVLAALIIALFTLLIEISIKNKKAGYRSGASPGKDRSGGFASEPKPVSTASQKDKASLQGKNTPAPAPIPVPSETKTPLSEDLALPSDDFFPLDAPDDTPFGEVNFDEDEETPPKAVSAENTNPQGLYTARGNVGWESYIQDRLASEIHRCASFEQDLSLLAIEFKGTKKISNAEYRKFTDEAVDFFSMRDLIFEKGERGISVIIPGMDLDLAISKSEEFRSHILSSLPESFEDRNGLCVGISSRSGRLIKSDRLMLEAYTALKKAIDDPVSPVIAFKSDPEKYRDFIKGHR